MIGSIAAREVRRQQATKVSLANGDNAGEDIDDS